MNRVSNCQRLSFIQSFASYCKNLLWKIEMGRLRALSESKPLLRSRFLVHEKLDRNSRWLIPGCLKFGGCLSDPVSPGATRWRSSTVPRFERSKGIRVFIRWTLLSSLIIHSRIDRSNSRSLLSSIATLFFSKSSRFPINFNASDE